MTPSSPDIIGIVKELQELHKKFNDPKEWVGCGCILKSNGGKLLLRYCEHFPAIAQALLSTDAKLREVVAIMDRDTPPIPEQWTGSPKEWCWVDANNRMREIRAALSQIRNLPPTV
jgi:hypothetical protein